MLLLDMHLKGYFEPNLLTELHTGHAGCLTVGVLPISFAMCMSVLPSWLTALGYRLEF